MTANEFRRGYIETLPEGGVARHYQLYPMPYPADVAHSLFSGSATIHEVIGADFQELFGTLKERGIHLERLRALGRPGLLGVTREIIDNELTFLSIAQTAVNEIARVVWYDDKLVNELTDVCGKDSPFASSYRSSIVDGVPRASFWGTYSPDQSLMALRATTYSDDEPTLLQSSLVYTPPFHTDVLNYEQFWRNIYHDPYRSFNPALASGDM